MGQKGLMPKCARKHALSINQSGQRRQQTTEGLSMAGASVVWLASFRCNASSGGCALDCFSRKCSSTVFPRRTNFSHKVLPAKASVGWVVVGISRRL
jgi:hypothetical protein